jgi:hypothetical protein
MTNFALCAASNECNKQGAEGAFRLTNYSTFRELLMKKILFALALAVSGFGVTAPTFAADMHGPRVVHHRHHHPVCHTYRSHGHLVRRCR